MNPFDIFNAIHLWNGCPDPRPWVIVELRGPGLYGCIPLSGECYAGDCFAIDQNHPDFPATGLKKTSHAHDSHIHELLFAEFGRRRGQIENDLLKEFRDFTGC
jgi:hypothetical protein